MNMILPKHGMGAYFGCTYVCGKHFVLGECFINMEGRFYCNYRKDGHKSFMKIIFVDILLEYSVG